MQYKITKQFGTGREVADKTFTTLFEATEHVQQCAEADAAMKVKTVYRVYEFDEVIHEVNSATVVLSSPSSESSGSGSGKGSGISFNPSPLMTSAKPKGAIQHWKKNDEDEKE